MPPSLVKITFDMEPLQDVQEALEGDLPAFTNVAKTSGVSDPSLVTLPSQAPLAPSRPPAPLPGPEPSHCREGEEEASHTSKIPRSQAPEPPGEHPVGQGDQRSRPEG